MVKVTINNKELKSLIDYAHDSHCYNYNSKEFDYNGLAKLGLCPYQDTAKGTIAEVANVIWNKFQLNDSTNKSDENIIIIFDKDRFKRNHSGAYEATYWEGVDSIRNKIQEVA